MNTGVILKSVFVCLAVALVLAFASLTVPLGSIQSALMHPGFWVLYLKAAGWLFLAGFISTIIVLAIGGNAKK